MRTVGSIFISILFLVLAKPVLAQTITLDSTIHYQTWKAWAGTEFCYDKNNCPSWPSFRDTALDMAVSDLGINGWVMEVWSGLENPTDYWTQYQSGLITITEYINNFLYQIINDNADPNVINWSGFQFSNMDYKVSNVWIPMKQRILAAGGQPFFLLKYVDFPRSVRTFNFCDDANGDEYAEFILAIYQHLNNKYGFVPDALDLINEPDNIAYAQCWRDPAKLGRYIKTVGDRLTANGFSAKIVAPSNANLIYASTYFDGLWANIGARQYITDISFHEYGGLSDQALSNIGTRAISNNISSFLTEYYPPDYNRLHKDIKLAMVSSWDGTYTMIGNAAGSGDGSWLRENETTGAVTIGNGAKYIRQYSKFIKPGAVRIAASTDNANFDPVAFINSDGKYVVVVKAASAGSFSIQGLPSGTYGIKYTTPGQYGIDLANQAIGSGQSISTNIPYAGAITIYGKLQPPSDTQVPSVPANLTATAISSSQINLYWTVSTDNVGIVGYRIYRCAGAGCNPTAQIATSPTNSYSQTGLTANTTYVYRVAAYDAAGNVSGQSISAQVTTLAGGATTVRFYSGAGDGQIRSQASTWIAARNAYDGDLADYNLSYLRIYSDNAITKTIYRSFLPFDTSALPDNANILSATLNLYPYSKVDNSNDGNDFVVLVQASQASPSSVSLSDFDQVGATEGSSRINISTAVLNAYASFNLNSAGLTWIKKTAADPYTKLGIREGHDLLNLPPSGDLDYRVYSSEQTGTAQDPYLEVTYIIGSDTIPPANPTGVTVL